MFGGKKNKPNPAAKGTTLLAPSVVVLGDVKFDGHLEVEGKVVGNIYAEDGSEARIRILEKGTVEGEVRAPNVIINGQVKGDVYATNHLELAEHAVVHGNVHYQVIEMVKGAQVNGKLVHSVEAPVKLKKPTQSAIEAAPVSEKPGAASDTSGKPAGKG